MPRTDPIRFVGECDCDRTVCVTRPMYTVESKSNLYGECRACASVVKCDRQNNTDEVIA